jgi:VWFA-related protein
MRRLVVLALVGCLWGAVRPAADAQQPSPSDQTFRTGVDVIRLDVSVLDKQRRPVRGLTAADFVIKEDGRPQRIVAVTEVDDASIPPPSAWMRHAPRDVVSNDLGDELAEGQAVAIVLDDFAIPDDSVEMSVSTREIARYIVNSLHPSDVAAVVYPFKPGRTQDFTRDRLKLFAAIDKFDPEQPEWRFLQPLHSGPIVGDIQRYNTALGRDPCLQLQPVIPTLRAVTSRLATVPNRRKSLYYVSTGIPFTFRPGRTRCQGLLYDEMRKTFETAQRFNVIMHGIDPAGAAGFQRYLQQPRLRNVRLEPGRDLIAAREIATRRHDFLKLLGEQTGGRPVVDSDDLEASVADILHEYGSYYLIGYETTNGDPDGKFRRLDVEVAGRDDLILRTKSGRWAPNEESVVAEHGPRAVTCLLECWHEQPAASEFHLAGLMPNQPLRLRAAVYPMTRATGALPPGSGGAIDVAAVLTVRLSAVLRQVEDTVTLVRTAYDADGKGSPPVQEMFVRRVDPGGGDETRYDIFTRFSLEPGRHHVRFHATSRLADMSGSVFVEVDVPDTARGSASASSIVLGRRSTERQDPLAGLVPVVPVTERDFTKADVVTAFVRLHAGSAEPGRAVEVAARIVGADDRELLELPPAVIAPDAFSETRDADYLLDLPLSRLPSGLHLLSLTATFDERRVLRRDLVFRVR